MEIKFKKITPYNIFIKWPKIILWKLKEKINKGPFKMLLFPNSPIILKDYHNIRFILYPWNKHPLKKILTRNNCEKEFKALKKLVKKNNIVFDLGANIGIHTTILSRLVNKNGEIYSFEPANDTYWELRETIALNKLDNTKAYKLAIGKKIGEKTINLFSKNNSEWNSFGRPNFNNILPSSSEEVKITTLDNFCENNNITKIDFLKIDVEGFEKDVLIGAKNLLKNKKIKCLSFEISQIPLQGASMKSKDIFDILKSYDYLSFKFNPDNEEFKGPFNDSAEFHENYYASYNDLTKI